jgi:hypothetical protein
MTPFRSLATVRTNTTVAGCTLGWHQSSELDVDGTKLPGRGGAKHADADAVVCRSCEYGPTLVVGHDLGTSHDRGPGYNLRYATPPEGTRPRCGRRVLEDGVGLPTRGGVADRVARTVEGDEPVLCGRKIRARYDKPSCCPYLLNSHGLLLSPPEGGCLLPALAGCAVLFEVLVVQFRLLVEDGLHDVADLNVLVGLLVGLDREVDLLLGGSGHDPAGA